LAPAQFWALAPVEFWWQVDARRPRKSYGSLTEADMDEMIAMLEANGG